MKKLLTTDEAALLLGIRPWTLRSWVSHRKIPYVKLGRLVRFDPTKLEAFVNGNTVEPEFMGKWKPELRNS